MPAPISILLAASLLLAMPVHAGIEVENAWISEAPPPAGINAGYFMLINNSTASLQLLKVVSPQFARAEMHQNTLTTAGTVSMQLLESVAVPAGETVTFVPGGRHLMLYEPVSVLRIGDTVELRLYFSDDSVLRISAPVRRISDQTRSHQH